MLNSGSGPSGNNRSQSDQGFFKRGDIVWAKVRGYSWWPAKVNFL